MKKLLLALAAISVLGTVAAAIVVSNNDFVSIQSSLEIKNRATATSANLYPKTSAGAMYPGNTFYFADYTDGQWYVDAPDGEDRNVWAHFMTSDGKAADVKLGKQAFTDSSNKRVARCTVPEIPDGSSQVTFSEVLTIRVDNDSKTLQWESSGKASNNSGNKTLSGDIDCICVNQDGTYGTKTLGPGEQIRVLAWANDWSHPVANGNDGVTHLCDANSSLSSENLTKLESQWANSASLFAGYTPEIKYAFSSVTAVADPDENWQPSMAGMAARYDWIYSKYSQGYGITLENWADRTIA
ncbi:MAG: hypothetical protein SPL80_01865 [Bacilli bacterium]|nr:hypothetical protein [Bacilli bacterium]